MNALVNFFKHLHKSKSVLLIVLIFSISVCMCGGSSSSNSGTQTHPPLNSEVIMIGDSYFAMDGYIANELENLSGESYRHYYMNGTGFNISYGMPIGQQYTYARSIDSNIKIVIMNGGGNDIFDDSDCMTYGLNGNCEECIDSVVDTAESLVQQMFLNNADHVIFLFYPHLINSMASMNPILDYAAGEIASRITDSRFHFINPSTEFAGHSEYFKTDNLHPSKAGGDVLAGLIWDVMENF
ncbi:MAG: SGNH/GDSL hydrolase family protein [Spirochaetota bacterium]